MEPQENGDLVGRAERALLTYNATPFANYLPCTTNTGPLLERLAQLLPRILLPMHGATYRGDGLRTLAEVMRQHTVVVR